MSDRTSALQKKTANNHVAMPQQNRVRHKREGLVCTLNGISMKFLCEIFALCSPSISSSSNIKKDDGLPTFSQLFLCLFLFLSVYFLYMIFFHSSHLFASLIWREGIVLYAWAGDNMVPFVGMFVCMYACVCERAREIKSAAFFAIV